MSHHPCWTSGSSLSYAAVHLLTWAGIGDIVNRFRMLTPFPTAA
jgi:hypothetical protein